MNAATFLLSVIFMNGIPGSPALVNSEDDATGQAYRAAYKLIVEEKYSAGIQALQAFLEKHRSSNWDAEARFWICYATEKTEASPEKSFECYQKFIQTNSGSRWANDARINMVRIAHQLAKEGKPQFEQQVRPFAETADNEIEMTALAALLDLGDEQSLAKVLDRIDRIPNEAVRAKMVRTLEDHTDSPAVVHKLSDIARKDSSERVRISAIRSLADSGSRDALALLREKVQSSDTLGVRRAALRAMSDMQEHYTEVLAYLKTVAETESNTELAVGAARAIGDTGSNEAVAALKEIYAKTTSTEVRKAVTRALADSSADAKEVIPTLLQIAQKDGKPEIRRSAISSLADIEGPEALAALKELAASGGEYETRAAALRALGDRPGKESVEMLVPLLTSEKDSRLRRAIVRALGDTRDDGSVSALEHAAKADPDFEVRKDAVHALGDIGTPAARAALMRLIGSK
jgi:HEAT repeat protein